mgnify:CR=1 FL=1
MQLEIGEFGLSSLIGINATNSTLYEKDRKGESTPLLFIDSFSAIVQPFQLLLGQPASSIQSSIFNGEIQSNISAESFAPETISLDWTASGLSMELMPILSEGFEANLGGKLSSEAELNIGLAESHKNIKGTAAIDILGFSITGAKAQGISLPDLVFSEAKIRAKAKDGKIELDGTSFVSDDISLGISGTITLNKRFNRSRLKLILELELGSKFDLISKMVPELKQNKQPDGRYKLTVIGTVANPKIRTKRGGKKSNNRNKEDRPTSTNREVEKERNSRPKLSPEERRKQRRERMERRKKEREQRALDEDSNGPDDSDEESSAPERRITRPSVGRSKLRDIPFTPSDAIDDSEEEEVDEQIQTVLFRYIQHRNE